MISVGAKDRKVIKAFCAGKPEHKGYKLDTNGKQLDGLWMGGKHIADRDDEGYITLNDTGGKSAEVVQRAIKREADPWQVRGTDAHRKLSVKDFTPR